MTKCVICEQRPAHEEGYCVPCGNKITAERKSRAGSKPQHFLHYRGHVVGLYAIGNGQLTGRLLNRSPERLPKQKTIDLNHYCNGFTRKTVKKLKACVLSLANA